MLLQYAIRRLLQMIPIIFGVVLLTFILFNVVGGSPASFVLGKNASVKALDEFDRLHGYDRPLFWGSLLKTRAVNEWRVLPDDSHTLQVDLHYPLKENTSYVLRIDGAPRQDLSFLPETVMVPDNARRLQWTLEGEPVIRRVILFERAGDPWHSQLIGYMGKLMRFDFGVSTDTGERVTDILKRGAWPSLALNLPVLIGGTLLAVLMALLCAWRRDRAADRFMVVAATALMSVNYIVWIVAGQYLFAYRLGWFPIWGFESWRYLLLPVIIGIATGLGRDVRFYRTIMLEEVTRDYVKTAQAKGLGTGSILFRHILKNALPPIITNVSLSLPFLFTGSLLLESFFGIPGLGGLSVNAINSSDMAVVQAVVLIGALLYVVVNLLTDLCYAWVDPRVRLK